MASNIPRGNVRGLIVYQQSINVGSVDANTTAEQDFTVTGVLAGDVVVPVKPTLSAGLGIVNCRVKANDTVSIQFVNATAAPIDPAAETYTFLVFRPDNGTAQTNVVF